MCKKINKAKVLDTLMNLPDVVWQGPLLEYKKEYKDLVKKMRSDKIEKVLGYRGKDEIIHIDDFVLEN